MNRLTALAAAAVLATAGLVRADYPPSTAAPAGYPPTVQSMEPAAPSGSVQPPAPPAEGRPAPKVQVFPFEPVGDAGQLDWVGKGLQASLQSDVSHTGAMLLMAPGAPAAGFNLAAIARSNGADLAVTGTYQVQGSDVRADGHLIDVATGQQVGGFSGRAPAANVFQLEDALGQQLQRLLPLDRPAMAAPGSVRPDGTAYAQPAPAAPATVTVLDDPTPSYTEPAVVNNSYYTAPTTGYSYPDSFYGGYGYGYPYGGYYGGYDPFLFGVGFGLYGGYGYRGNYGRGYGYGYGRGGYGAGHYGSGGYGGGRGYVLGNGGGRSYGGGGGGITGFHTAAFGGGGFGGGGFHGGGGGGHR